jgi:hypothetical protein
MSRDLDLDAVFGGSSPAEAFAAVLTEARMVLGEFTGPLDAELWGSDILAALGGLKSNAATEIVPAAEATGTAEALAILRVFAAVGWPELRSAAMQAADRLAKRGLDEQGLDEPPWAALMGAPTVRECWRYGDDRGLQEAVTMSFSYEAERHVVSLLLDHGFGGAIKDVWVGAAGDVLARTRAMADQDPTMVFEMISPSDAHARAVRAIAAGECPTQPDETGNVASTRAILRARVALLPAAAERTDEPTGKRTDEPTAEHTGERTDEPTGESTDER